MDLIRYLAVVFYPVFLVVVMIGGYLFISGYKSKQIIRACLWATIIAEAYWIWLWVTVIK